MFIICDSSSLLSCSISILLWIFLFIFMSWKGSRGCILLDVVSLPFLDIIYIVGQINMYAGYG